MASPQLTKNAISQILQGVDVPNPVLQVLAYKSVAPDGDAQQRVRFILSDGDYSHQCCIMVGPQNVARVEKGEFERFSIIKLAGYFVNSVSGKKVIIMNDCKVLKAGSLVVNRIGNPVNFAPDEKGASFSTPAAKANGSAAPSPGVKRPNGAARPTDGVASSPKRGRANNSSSQVALVPIGSLNPFQNRWVIKGRVVSKGAVKTWSNQKGEGKLFSFELKDDSGAIRVTSFGQECDRFLPLVEMGKVLRVARGHVKNANKAFNTADYEVTLGTDSTVEEDLDDDNIPQITYNFVDIKSIESADANQILDVAGVIRKVDDIVIIIQKTTQKELKKREVTIVDMSEVEIKVTIWGQDAVDFAGLEGNVLFLRGGKVSDYNGKSLTATVGSSLQIDPDHDKANELSSWYQGIQTLLKPKSLSGIAMTGADPVKFLFQAFAESTASHKAGNPKPIYFVARVFIGQMGRTNSYLACKSCRSKVQDMNNDFYKCYKCNKDVEVEKRLIQSVCLADETHEVWGTAFHDEAVALTCKSATELLEMKEADDAGYQDHLLSITFRSYMAKLNCKVEMYKEEERVKTTIMRLEPLDYVAYSRQLLERIKVMS